MPEAVVRREPIEANDINLNNTQSEISTKNFTIATNLPDTRNTDSADCGEPAFPPRSKSIYFSQFVTTVSIAVFEKFEF